MPNRRRFSPEQQIKYHRLVAEHEAALHFAGNLAAQGALESIAFCEALEDAAGLYRRIQAMLGQDRQRIQERGAA